MSMPLIPENIFSGANVFTDISSISSISPHIIAKPNPISIPAMTDITLFLKIYGVISSISAINASSVNSPETP